MIIDVDAFIPSNSIEVKINNETIKLKKKTARLELIYQKYAIESDRVNKLLKENQLDPEALQASNDNYNYLVDNIASPIMGKTPEEIIDNYSSDQITTLVVLWISSTGKETSQEGSGEESKKK